MNSSQGSTVDFVNVSKRYGSTEALVDFSLSINASEFVTLLGPSGSGKTTALNIISGFIEPSAGDLRIGGESVIHLAPEKRNLGMVFQGYSLFPHFTVFDNVAFPLRLRKVSSREIKTRVNEALSMVQLTGMNDRLPSELSGGQRQRVALARAVVFRPPVLLMDEPLGALDLKLRRAMQGEITSLQRELGCTVVFVTHDQDEALSMSDRIVVMQEARIVQIGQPQHVYDNPENEYVANFLGVSNVLKAEYSPSSGLSLPELKKSGINVSFESDKKKPTAVCIRPESIQLVRNQSLDITFQANVTDVTFLGDSVNYTIMTETGVKLQVKHLVDRGVTLLERGSLMNFGFQGASIIPL